MSALGPLLAAAAAFLTVVVVALSAATPPAAATVIRRETIASGDTILADVLIPGEIDEYVFLAPRGSTATIAFGKVPPGDWRTSLGLFDQNYGAMSLTGTTPTVASNPEPFLSSGQARLLFSTSGRSVGGYRFRFTLAPKRAFTFAGKGDAAAPALLLGAFADSELTVSIRWRGGTGVTLGSVTGPDGPLTSAAAPVVKGPTSVQGGFVTPAFGDVSLALVVPPGTKSWSVKVGVKSPPPAKGTVRDLRLDEPERRPGIDLRNVSDTPVAVIADERGGPNDLIALPGSTIPGIRILDLRAFGCGGAALEAGPEPTSYAFTCANGWRAEIRDVTRVEGRVTGFKAIELVSPAGTGSVEISDAVFNAAGQPTGWTDVRRFDATGNVHRIEFSNVLRNPGGSVISYSVLYTPPGGVARRYDYAPVRGF